jgi:hypothetical protein
MATQLLHPVDTTPIAFRPDPVSDAEAAAMLRAALVLFGKWALTDEQAALLLDLPIRTFRRWKAGDVGRIDRDLRARLSNLMGIHKALRLIFRFDGASALGVMLGGELTDLMRVRRYLDAERGGW